MKYIVQGADCNLYPIKKSKVLFKHRPRTFISIVPVKPESQKQSKEHGKEEDDLLSAHFWQARKHMSAACIHGRLEEGSRMKGTLNPLSSPHILCHYCHLHYH